MTERKLLHFQLLGPFGSKLTLIGMINKSIKYTLYSGWSSSGMPNNLSNLQAGDLPVYPQEDETETEFIKRIKEQVNSGVYKVENEVVTTIIFAPEPRTRIK